MQGIIGSYFFEKDGWNATSDDDILNTIKTTRLQNIPDPSNHC